MHMINQRPDIKAYCFRAMRGAAVLSLPVRQPSAASHAFDPSDQTDSHRPAAWLRPRGPTDPVCEPLGALSRRGQDICLERGDCCPVPMSRSRPAAAATRSKEWRIRGGGLPPRGACAQGVVEPSSGGAAIKTSSCWPTNRGTLGVESTAYRI